MILKRGFEMINKNKVFGYLSGFHFSFLENGQEITIWYSVFSGSEKVFVNGEVIS